MKLRNEKAVKVKKVRVDDLLVERGYALDLKAARGLVLAGDVFERQDHRVSSSAHKVAEDAPLRVRTKNSHGWVSRGGVKLHHAIQHFGLEDKLRSAVAIDVGASTGGFTDVLLHHGAEKVYAVDVARGILDWRLRTDDRVVLLERTNARHLQASQVEDAGRVRAVVCDASFISLTLVLPPAMAMCEDGALLAALIKPQFEADREDVGKGGIVSDPEIHTQVCDKITSWLGVNHPQWSILGIVESPIKGADSNTEFILVAQLFSN
eukprot:CAMPEP_0113936920 /NCGR_PEP_ID=MMETSP1339-20121228/3666_1 /TAXON_ID=94617 /ORGANISM="Fibrocapsa japonica" /LENGTH=264 /DNA_ID=CAMNT_0000939503 /DNA_START=202 /DNA_END=993 /DNA_ORIENTATION=+ /assembly_acc=CAM_ASM_000762